MEMDKELLTAELLTNLYYDFSQCFKLDVTSYQLDMVIARTVAKRYWLDVKRMHNFHKIEFIDSHKIAGYLTYWICKLRPINVLDVKVYKSNTKTATYINELFALYVAIGRRYGHYKQSNQHKDIILQDKFVKSFVYTLKYRLTTGDNLSTMYYLMEDK